MASSRCPASLPRCGSLHDGERQIHGVRSWSRRNTEKPPDAFHTSDGHHREEGVKTRLLQRRPLEAISTYRRRARRHGVPCRLRGRIRQCEPMSPSSLASLFKVCLGANAVKRRTSPTRVGLELARLPSRNSLAPLSNRVRPVHVYESCGGQFVLPGVRSRCSS